MWPEIESASPPSSLAKLLRGIIDYAGTFPPAGLELPDAIAHYAEYRRGADAWMLNRFVLSARDLRAFEQEVRRFTSGERPWRLSVVCTGEEDLELASRWSSALAVVESLEVKAPLPPATSSPEVFVELPSPWDDDGALRELHEQGALLKIRLGGERPESIPSSSLVAPVLTHCAEIGLPLKATAGLHHAMRVDGHGFLNLLFAATLARDGGTAAEVGSVLDETDTSTLAFDKDSASWGSYRFSLETIATSRTFFRSFGSCSFEEPLESLAGLGLRTP